MFIQFFSFCEFKWSKEVLFHRSTTFSSSVILIVVLSQQKKMLPASESHPRIKGPLAPSNSEILKLPYQSGTIN